MKLYRNPTYPIRHDALNEFMRKNGLERADHYRGHLIPAEKLKKRQVKALVQAGYTPVKGHWYAIDPVPDMATRHSIGDMLGQTPVRVVEPSGDERRLCVVFVDAVSAELQAQVQRKLGLTFLPMIPGLKKVA